MTILHIVLKFQFDHVCFQAREESANFDGKLMSTQHTVLIILVVTEEIKLIFAVLHVSLNNGPYTLL